MSSACTTAGNKYISLPELAALLNNTPWIPSDTPCPIHVVESPTNDDDGYIVSPFSGEFFDDSQTFTGIDLQTEIDLMHLYSCPGEHFLEPSERSEKVAQLSREETRKLLVGYDVETKPLLSKDGIQELTEDGHDASILVSHQFYLAWNGFRKALVLISSERFNESDILEFIARVVHERECSGDVVLTEKGKPVTVQAFLSAHFSVIEGGWMIQKNEPSCRLDEYADLLGDTETSIPLLAICASLKLLIRKLFSLKAQETGEEVVGLKSLDLSARENIVISHSESLHELDELIKTLPPVVKKRLQAFNRPKDAFNEICLRKDRDIAEFFDFPLEIRKFLHDQLLSAPLIPKREKTWHGSRNLYLSSEVRTFKTAGIVKLRESVKHFNCRALGLPQSSTELSVKQRLLSHAISLIPLRREQAEPAFSVFASRGAGNRRPKHRSASKVRYLPKRRLTFVDSNGFGAQSLKSVGKTIGIPKLEIDQTALTDMSKFFVEKPQKFVQYAFRDTVVSAEALAWNYRHFRKEFDANLKTRAASYSAEVIRNAFIRRVYTPDRQGLEYTKDNYRHYLGWEETKVELPPDPLNPNEPAKFKTIWEPSLVHKQFAEYYSGGWNAAFKVGSVGKTAYHDFKSAYPSALSCLLCDYDFSKPIRLVGEEAKRFIRERLKFGPFQIIGIKISFEFYEDAEPMFPMRIDEKQVSATLTPEGEDMILFARRGKADIMFPELWTAIEHKLIKPNYTIHSIETFEQIPGPSRLAELFREILSKRGKPGMKAVYKCTANFAYGKFCESIKKVLKKKGDELQRERIHPGPITCYPLAAYATAVCRSCIGELLALGNPCYAVTTDGYISPILKPSKLKTGPLIQGIQKRISELYAVKEDEFGNEIWKRYDFIERAFLGKKTLILKTRGYVLIGTDENNKPCLKLARAGIQTRVDLPADKSVVYPELKKFLDILSDGCFTKYSFRGFARLKDKGKNLIPVQVKSFTRISHSFDMKRIPVGEVKYSTFSFDGLKYKHPLIVTRPLEDTSEYIIHRKERVRNMKPAHYNRIIQKYAARNAYLNPRPVTRLQLTPKVCLCGSMTRFSAVIREVAAELELAGVPVQMPVQLSPAQAANLTTEQKDRLREHHFRRIFDSEIVLIVDTDPSSGLRHIGSDTQLEIDFAENLGKTVYYLSDSGLTAFLNEIAVP